MKKLNYLFLSIFLFSCGVEQKSSTKSGIGAQMNIEVAITEEKKIWARKLCDAMRSKRLKIAGASRPEKITFKVSERNCTNTSSGYNVDVEISRSVNGGYVFMPYDSAIGNIRESLVQTELNGHLSSICTAITEDAEVGLVHLDTLNSVQAIDIEENGFTVSYGEKSSQTGYYNLVEKTSYSINTNAGHLQYGYVTKKTNEKSCHVEGDIQSETYSREITNFRL